MDASGTLAGMCTDDNSDRLVSTMLNPVIHLHYKCRLKNAVISANYLNRLSPFIPVRHIHTEFIGMYMNDLWHKTQLRCRLETNTARQILQLGPDHLLSERWHKMLQHSRLLLPTQPKILILYNATDNHNGKSTLYPSHCQSYDSI